MYQTQENTEELFLGIDMGSTTVKYVVLHPTNNEIVSSAYRRHDGAPLETLLAICDNLHALYPQSSFLTALTGSQSSDYAKWINAPYIQEVIAGSIAVSRYYPQIQTSIELGGQDAKILFFSPEEKGVIRDMRMNGVCAGGTGAFLDQIAALLNIPVEEFDTVARAGTQVHDISGRCGVFAKTDIQPLLNQGIPREDIALSCLHALAKQTIGGLAQGMEIRTPVLFAGGPFFFIPTLQKVFCERLNLTDTQAIFPQNAQTLIAQGAALTFETSLGKKYHSPLKALAIKEILIEHSRRRETQTTESADTFFSDREEQDTFMAHYAYPSFSPRTYPSGTNIPVYIGIDAGSTSTKFVVLDEHKDVMYTFYQNNQGKPIETALQGLLDFKDFYDRQNVTITVEGLGTTGYGEMLFALAFGGDYHTVETIAHKEAAYFFDPEVSFILDLGGQDMKAIFVRNGVITDIILNEACSAGCGSFIESYSRSLDIPPQDIAELVFNATNPSVLGSRCTVFMNSSIITEQKSGKTVGDILAGLCRSVIENLFTKVLRISNPDVLGKHIVVQGGTFRNDAVLRAFTRYIDREVVRPPFAGEMGALGIALLTMNQRKQWTKSRFIGLDALKDVRYETIDSNRCPFCANACARSIIRFNNGATFVSGNRCERGEVVEDPGKDSTKTLSGAQKKRIPDMMREREKLLIKNYNKSFPATEQKGSIGIPLVLDFYDSLPFWGTLFAALGYQVVLSARSSSTLFENGLAHIPSDTICLPAKVVHGHMKDLLKKGVDKIFFPAIHKNIKLNPHAEDSWNCAVLMGYPEVIRISEWSDPLYQKIELLAPVFKWTSAKLKQEQIIRFFAESLNEPRSTIEKALQQADKAQKIYRTTLIKRGDEIMQSLRESKSFGILLSGRPYHGDMFINHGVADLFTARGVAVLINECFDLDTTNVRACRIDTYNPFHTRMLAAAQLIAQEPNLELVQLVSFGCGHDAILSDEIDRILRSGSDKSLLSLKLDEGENKGPLSIRITSFIETVKTRRHLNPIISQIPDSPDSRLFLKKDRRREILIPNLSPSFSYLMNEAFADQGYRSRILPMADRQAIDYGKRFVHNDMCFPAQVNIGEHLRWLHKNPNQRDSVAIMLAKNCNDCRAGHYSALARKALDANGFTDIPILTTDFSDKQKIHPGFKINDLRFRLFSLRGIVFIDALDDMQRKCRPYEKVVGSTNQLHEEWAKKVLQTLREKGWKKALEYLKKAISAFNTLQTDRNIRRPRVGIIGEILINYHEAGNYRIVDYLEQNGMEVVLPALIEFWRQDAVNFQVMSERGHSRSPVFRSYMAQIYDKLFSTLINAVEKEMIQFKYYEEHSDIFEIAEEARTITDIAFRTGEGWLIPGEIMSWIKKGIYSHLIVQPFGCLPNHITGRGTTKAIKERHPQVTILSLDFDPDTSLANLHNRMQMIILNAETQQQELDKS